MSNRQDIKKEPNLNRASIFIHEPEKKLLNRKQFIFQLNNHTTTLTFADRPGILNRSYCLRATNELGTEECFLPKALGDLLISKLATKNGVEIIAILEAINQNCKKVADLITGYASVEEKRVSFRM